jgi:hypothetical protein
VTPRRRANFYLDDELLEGLKALKARIGVPAEYLERNGVHVPAVKAERKRAQTRRRP